MTNLHSLIYRSKLVSDSTPGVQNTRENLFRRHSGCDVAPPSALSLSSDGLLLLFFFFASLFPLCLHTPFTASLCGQFDGVSWAKVSSNPQQQDAGLACWCRGLPLLFLFRSVALQDLSLSLSPSVSLSLSVLAMTKAPPSVSVCSICCFPFPLFLLFPPSFEYLRDEILRTSPPLNLFLFNSFFWNRCQSLSGLFSFLCFVQEGIFEF